MTFTSRPLLSLVTLEDGALSEEVIDSGFGLPSISLFRFSIAANFPSRANFSGFCGTCLAETSSFLPSSFDFSPLIPFPNSPAEPGSVSSFFSSFLLPSGGWQSPFFDDSAFSLDSTSAFESEPASLALFTSVVSSEDSFLQLPFFVSSECFRVIIPCCSRYSIMSFGTTLFSSFTPSQSRNATRKLSFMGKIVSPNLVIT
mmetsp:Transcript_14447/g.30386  ORF Transcript_14447/g.30386 Transcript_14447/m.30386 type:complete len:201 (-) Transcript_14447:3681-4283(-)